MIRSCSTITRRSGWLFAGLFLLFLSHSLLAQHPDSSASGASKIPDSDTLAAHTPHTGNPRELARTIDNRAFSVGEKLTFKIRYGWIKAGEATMEVQELIQVNESDSAYRIISRANSSRGFDPFYKVRDVVETHLDYRGFFSWYFAKELREGGYKFDLSVKYDQILGVADVATIRYHKDEPLRIRRKTEYSLNIPEYVLDVLGAFYYVRTRQLRVGEPVYMTNHDKKKIYNLQVLVEKRETVEVEAGKFRCIKVQPRLEGDAIFKQDGKLWVWLTDDDYRIPVQMKSKVAVGSITTELIRMEGVPDLLPSRIK